MNTQRLDQLKALFAREGYHALLCRMPQHVVMFTGYQPILGNTFCLISLNTAHELEMRLAVPVDEQDMVPQTGIAEVKTFAEETMTYIGTTLDAVRKPLGELLRAAGLNEGAVVGIEGGRSPIIPAYTQVGVTGPETRNLLHLLLLGGEYRDATSLLDELAAIKTEDELAAIRRSEAVACAGFAAAREAIHPGATEADVAAATYAALLRAGYAAPNAQHVQPHVHVMAGPRAALAYRAFNLTSPASINQGDTVTVQMEIGVNGYWAELTRTFFAGSISEEWRKAHQACVAAQDAALQHIRAGASAREVDGAARKVMEQAGFGSAFKHGLGHGFGFQAINHAASPVLHPASKATLQSGMVHNMEPAVYLDGKGGLRLNDNVAVRQDGNELLSGELSRDLDWLVVNG
jgi:Xaa-Pro aminopeptidase